MKFFINVFAKLFKITPCWAVCFAIFGGGGRVVSKFPSALCPFKSLWVAALFCQIKPRQACKLFGKLHRFVFIISCDVRVAVYGINTTVLSSFITQNSGQLSGVNFGDGNGVMAL